MHFSANRNCGELIHAIYVSNELYVSSSPDNECIYFIKGEKQPTPGANGLYQVNVRGGDIKKVIGNVHSPISFSPDGKQFAFFRRYMAAGANALLIANLDGTGEKELARRNLPEWLEDHPVGPAWSPDGQVIACGINHNVGDAPHDTELVAIRVDDRSEKSIGHILPYERLYGLAWLADQSALILTAVDGTRFPEISHLLLFSYPNGERRSIIEYPGQCTGLSVTTDAKTLITTENRFTNNVWVGSSEDMNQIKEITTGAGRRPGLSWTPDGRILYAELSDGPPNLWIMDADGTGKKQLTFTTASVPSVTPDGQYIVLVSGLTLSRTNLDGSNLKQLVEFSSENDLGVPQCSPDSKWVIYENRGSIWKVSIEGGTPVALTDRALDEAWPQAISPDGKHIAYYSRKGSIEVMPFEGGQPVLNFPISQKDELGGMQWAPDGHSIQYVVHFGGASNIWMQPLDGRPPKRLTDFKSGRIYRFAWSQDGKQFAITRGQDIKDILMLVTCI